jgi:hypothetical protein
MRHPGKMAGPGKHVSSPGNPVLDYAGEKKRKLRSRRGIIAANGNTELGKTLEKRGLGDITSPALP